MENRSVLEGMDKLADASEDNGGDALQVNASEKTPILVKSIDEQKQESKSSNCYIYALTFFAALGGFLFGYDTGVISGVMLLLKQIFNLNSLWQELIVSVTVGGAIVGAFLGGFFSDKLGRKPVLLFAAFIFTAGAVIMGVSYSKEVLLIGRITVGIGIGFASMAVPVYIAEAAPISIRGTLVTINQLFITLGQCAASIVDGLFSKDTHNGWRFMLALSGIPSTVMLLGFIFMPESPRWLVSKGKKSKARDVLVQLRSSNNVDKELNGIVESCNTWEGEGSNFSVSRKFSRVLRTYYTRRALIVGCGLQAIQQLCGINTVMYYSATIIAMAGVHDQSQAIWLAAAVATGNFVFTLVSLWLVDRAGRRKLTLYSLIGVSLALALIATMFYLMKAESPRVNFVIGKSDCSRKESCFDCVDNPDCGFCYISLPSSNTYTNGSCALVNNTVQDKRPSYCTKHNIGNNTAFSWVTGACPTSFAWLAPFAMIFYLAMFAPGMGPMPWAVNAEIYPLWARSVGTASSTATNWFFNLLISLTFLHLMEYLGRPGTFILYTVISIVGWIFLYLLLPESKGKSLEEVENLFKGQLLVPFRKIGSDS